jgi:hypothetical protein
MQNQDKNKSRENVDDEVQKLFRKGAKVSANDISKLKSKYEDVDLVEKIQNAYIEKHTSISKKAKKFAQLIRTKYSDSNFPFHNLLEKARLFKVRHNLTDEEFAEFQRIYEQELIGLKSPEVLLPSTNMTKVLGSVSVDFQGFPLKLNDNDYKVLQEIIKLHSINKPLHAQVLLQSMQYNDCDYEALTGTYKRELGHRPGDHVHPVVAAMFLPKIDVLEQHFLHSNLAGIVKSRFNGEALTNRPDYELFYALTTDPNDVVCDNRSPIADLLNRAQVQHHLWSSVLSLRNGQYYNGEFRNFVSAIDMCRLNKQDTPDLVYGRYDGTIIKRLLASFSFRPTVVATTPLPMNNTFSLNPYLQNIRPAVTSVPMINLRLPPSIQNDDIVNLTDAITQQQLFIENNVPTLRHSSIIYSRGVLFFFVDRRAHFIKFNDIQPFNLNRMPLSLSGFESLNSSIVQYSNTITLESTEVFRLRSVVVAEVNRNTPEKELIVGSSTIFMSWDEHNMSVETFKYDPLGVINPYNIDNNITMNYPPLYTIPEDVRVDGDDKLQTFYELASRRGVVFMYELISSENKTGFSL